MSHYQQYVLRILLIISVEAILPLGIKMKLRDEDMYELTSEDRDYEEENESELIKPSDIANSGFLNEDDSRYKPLHSYVNNYNEYNKKKISIVDTINYLTPIVFETSDTDLEERPFVGELKTNFDENYANMKSHSAKREDDSHPHPHDSHPHPHDSHPYPHDTHGGENATDAEDEEDYDYETFKMEYYEQFGGNLNNTEELNETVSTQLNETMQDTIKNIISSVSENCSQESDGFSIEKVQCLINGVQDEKYYNKSMKKTMRRVWMMLKVWFVIYVCFAIILWCQRGWCCCCFRCKVCFPKKRLLQAKQYYVKNPPGVLAEDYAKGVSSDKVLKYEATEFEEDAYEQLETVIKNM